MVGKENDEGNIEYMNPDDHTMGDILDAEKMNSILGAIQIIYSDFEDAIGAIKPVTIKNARKMLAYALSPGRTIEKKYARNHDLEVLALMAEEENDDQTLDQIENDLKGIAKSHLLVVVFFQNTELYQITNKKTETIQEVYDKVIAEKFMFEKRLIANELKKYGIHSVLTQPENLTLDTINKYLEIKARGIL